MTESTGTDSCAAHNLAPPKVLGRKLFAIANLVPIGLFLVLHVWTQASALAGRSRYVHVVGRITGLRFFSLAEALLLGLPIVLHVVVGYRWASDASYRAEFYPKRSTALVITQRVCAVLTALFVLGHVFVLRTLHGLDRASPGVLFDALSAGLSSTQLYVPIVALAYVACLAATAFHVGNGLLMSVRCFGLCAATRWWRLWVAICVTVSVAIFCVALNTVVFHATGSILLPASFMGFDAAGSSQCVGVP